MKPLDTVTPLVSDPALIALLTHDLRQADYTVDRLGTLYSAESARALQRSQRVPVQRELDAIRRAGRLSAAGSLAWLFILGLPLEAAELETALPTLGVDGAKRLGLVQTMAPLLLAGTNGMSAAIEANLPPNETTGGVRRAETLGDGLAPATTEMLAPTIDLRPYAFSDRCGDGQWWIASDLGEMALDGPLPSEHVLGVGGASNTLSGLVIPRPGARALDLGTGCGIQALHLARFAASVIATDISERALNMAQFNAILNGVNRIEFRLGNLFEPVVGESFDQIVSNPPFVITPRSRTVPDYDYRDAGLVGDQLVRAVIEGAARHLNPGGIAQMLGNWEYHTASSGLARVEGWLHECSVQAPLEWWVIEREVQDPPSYAETWIRDGGTRPGHPDYENWYADWLDDFAARGVEAVGFGYLLLRSSQEPELKSREPETGSQKLQSGSLQHAPEPPEYESRSHEFESDSQESEPQNHTLPCADSTPASTPRTLLRRIERVETSGTAVPPSTTEYGTETAAGALALSEHLTQALDAHDMLASLSDEALLEVHPVVAGDATEERHYWPGAANPSAITLRQGGGFGRLYATDPALSGLVGTCDGELSLGAIIVAVASILEVNEQQLRDQLLPQVRELIFTGFLTIPAAK